MRLFLQKLSMHWIFKKPLTLFRRCWPQDPSYGIVTALAGFVVIWFVSGFFSFSGKKEEAPEKNIPRVQVQCFKARVQEPLLRLAGVTQEQRRVNIRAETNGQVRHVSVEKGKRVTQGELLVTLSLDSKAAKLAEAKALVDQRKLEYDVAQTLEKKSLRSRTNVADSKAKYEASLAVLRDIEVSIKDTKIVAPFTGVMNENFVEIGSYVTVGDEVLELVDLDPLKVVAYVPEKDFAALTPGKTVTIHMEDHEPIKGILTYTSVVADPNTRTFRVEVEIKNPHNTLISGRSAEILVPLHGIKTHRIPAALLILNQEGILGIHSVNAENRVEFHPITIMSHDGNGILVKDLPEEIRIITVGQDFVISKQEVMPVSQEKSSKPEEGRDLSSSSHESPSSHEEVSKGQSHGRSH